MTKVNDPDVGVAPFPWQVQQWQSLSMMTQKERLPHALLLQGLSGLGKLLFAKAFAKFLLCQNSNEHDVACGLCKSCQLIAAGSHPDLQIVEPEETGKAIKIDQIRAVNNTAYRTSQQQGYKVVIIAPAENMNSAAANALLKTLEEPPSAKALILLVANQPTSLLATIRSRCQRIVFQAPMKADAQSWLESHSPNKHLNELALALAQNAPLHAFELAHNDELKQGSALLADLYALVLNQAEPIQIAIKWLKVEFDRLLRWLFLWIKEIAQRQFSIDSTLKLEENVQQQLTQISHTIDKTGLFDFLDYLHQCQQWQNSKIKLNQQLQLEALFYKWTIIRGANVHV